VVSELSRRGLVALPTVRNCPGADVIVLDPASGGLASLQVKTSGSFAKFWPAQIPHELWRRPSHSYVFVRTAKDGRFEAFLADAASVAIAVSATVEWQRSQGRKVFPVFALPGSPAGSDVVGVEALRMAWANWVPTVA
jgi:hypothetical protein